jgi:hypothetical protein
MKPTQVLAMLTIPVVLASARGAVADESAPKEAARQIETDAQTTGEGISDTARGIGRTLSESAKTAGQRLEEASKAAEPDARQAWQRLKESAVSLGRGVRAFFARLMER